MGRIGFSLVAAFAVVLLGSPAARGDPITFTTSQSQFDTGVDNQGWWSTTSFNEDSNDNYLVGDLPVIEHRNFFTFDLSSLALPVTSAVLRIQRFESSAGTEATETLEFFDVTTDAATLNSNVGTSLSIFTDLGTGTSYGSFIVPGSGSLATILEFSLNSAALADISAAGGGFFSIGGRLISIDSGGDFLFGSSHGSGTGGWAGQLVVEPIPEPGTLLLLGSGLAGLAGFGRKKLGRKV